MKKKKKLKKKANKKKEKIIKKNKQNKQNEKKQQKTTKIARTGSTPNDKKPQNNDYSNIQFKGTAKVILNTEENYTKLMDYSGKLYLYHRTLFFKKFVDYRRDAHKNKSVPTKQTQSISQNLNKNRNNNWVEENFLVNQENTPPNISNKFNNNNNNQSQNNIGYLDKENEIKKISNNQIIILNLPKKTKKSNLLNLFKDYNPKKIIIFNNKYQILKYAFITFQTQLIRDNSLSLNEITFLNNKINIKKAFEKTQYKNNYQKNQNFQKKIKEYENKIMNLEREVQQLKLIIEQNENTLNLKFNKLNLKFLEEYISQENITFYQKKRNLLFIHKSGDEGVPLNYRPISINQTLPRFFLKLLYAGIQDSWDLVSKRQFGFKKKLDTRIAVLNLLNEYQKIKNKFKKENIYIVTIDIQKCFDSIHHSLIYYSIKKIIKNEIIKKYLLAYYSKEGIGVYQGDPLSPLLFGFISHFLLDKLKSIAIHVQMFADDLILIMKGSMIEINFQLEKIFKIIRDFGMNPNNKKTIKTLIPKEILYLGIWLDKKTHLKFNLDKVKKNFKNLVNILEQKKFTNGLKIHFFKAVLHSQLLYGLEIFDLNENNFKDIDIWINKKITKFLLINPHSPRLIYKTEAKIDSVRITIYKRKYKLIQKLNFLGFKKLIKLLPFREKEVENINWKSKNIKRFGIRIRQLSN
ncbi:nuclear intron maturase 1 -related [Anaeramoeba flamelloides]|uniref:Nuclear intron maturase 1 -related n=1 Tax=Anaeramoeba flamelloides TaxID=1746091 RepID=A0AAV7ZL57_9EUKA|nr:nuclear intron maturase 1 -related [Anaeramoeba flamelloides]